MSDQAEPQVSMTNVKARGTWLRGLYMLLFIIIYSIAEFLGGAIVLLQFLLMVLTGRTNDRLRGFSARLATFMYQVALYLTFNSEDKPYPFGAWPEQTPAPHQT
ncbi:MAG: DUF4389 domain-containing protein [Dongiaceae bacterium]